MTGEKVRQTTASNAFDPNFDWKKDFLGFRSMVTEDKHGSQA